MFHVRCEQDLQLLESSIQPGYFSTVTEWFQELRSASPLDGMGSPFTLDSGCIHVLEEGDGVPNALLSSWVDYSQLVTSDHDDLQVWKIVAIEEDWVDSWFAIKGSVSDLDAWAEQYLEDDPT